MPSGNKSMTVQEVEGDIRNMLGDALNYDPGDLETAGNTWDSETIYKAINFAVKEYCKKVKSATYTTTTLSLNLSAPYTNAIPNTITVPSDNLEVVRLYTLSSGTLLKTNRMMENLKNPQFEFEDGIYSKRWYMTDARTICLMPNITLTDQSYVLGYIQAPLHVTTSNSVSVGVLNVGQWYEIATIGTTDFTDIGAGVSTVGEQFKATGTDSGTGTVYEIIDPRIIPAHQEYLRYSAAAYLLNMAGDQESIVKATTYLKIFNDLVGA